MAANKTQLTRSSPAAFIDRVPDKQARKDCQELVGLMGEITGEPAAMWGPSIVGFGKHHYRYESGREGDMPVAAFSPRKQALVLYLGSVIQDPKIMAKLGPCKLGKGCLYIKRLDDIDRKVLRQLVVKSVAERQKRSASA